MKIDPRRQPSDPECGALGSGHKLPRLAVALCLLSIALITYGQPGLQGQWIAGGDPSLQTGQETSLTESELALWRSPEFQRRFTESFLAETDIEPTVTQPEREKMLKVLELISSDKLDEAARLLVKETKDSSSAVFDFTLANIYFRREQLDAAAAAYLRAVKKYDRFLRAWKNLGIIYVRTGEFEKAIPALTRVVELGGSDKYTYGMLGFQRGFAIVPPSDANASRLCRRLGADLPGRLRISVAATHGEENVRRTSCNICAGRAERHGLSERSRQHARQDRRSGADEPCDSGNDPCRR